MRWPKAVLLMAVIAASLMAAPSGAQDACDRVCLEQTAAEVVAGLRSGEIITALSADAELRENGDIVATVATIWRRVHAIRSSVTLADPVTGNAVLRAGVELDDGKPAYISARIRVAPSGRVTDVEIAADAGDMVVRDYVWNLDPAFSTELAPNQRISRSAMEAIVRRYFNALGTHIAIHTDFDDANCNRFHSGTQITNVAGPGIEGADQRTCASAIEGALPWGPAAVQRVPVIDDARGVVVGITLLHYPELNGQPTMYVTEVFKIVAGRIVLIDNIGLTQGNRASLGFVQ